MQMTWNDFHEVRFYIGSREKYAGPEFTRKEVTTFIGQFQSERSEDMMPVRVTPTSYVCEDYQEDGWELAVIGYPRTNKPKNIINRFVLDLAEAMLYHFKQNRISVIFPDEIVMLQNESAVEKHR